MSFLTRTRIVQYADLIGNVQTVLPVPTVFKTGPLGLIIISSSTAMAEAMALVPVNQQPAQTDWWKYRLEWEVHYYAIPTIVGVIPGGTLILESLVFDSDYWDSSADNIAGNPPLRRNRHSHQFTQKNLAGAGQLILAEIDEFLMRAEFQNLRADSRDPIVTTTDQSQDPMNLLTRPAITSRNGVPIDFPTHWTTYGAV